MKPPIPLAAGNPVVRAELAVQLFHLLQGFDLLIVQPHGDFDHIRVSDRNAGAMDLMSLLCSS
jgi:hypothetical protein